MTSSFHSTWGYHLRKILHIDHVVQLINTCKFIYEIHFSREFIHVESGIWEQIFLLLNISTGSFFWRERNADLLCSQVHKTSIKISHQRGFFLTTMTILITQKVGQYKIPWEKLTVTKKKDIVCSDNKNISRSQ